MVVVGPLGPLWTYHIISLQAEGTAARVNWLVMPHARITRKGTAIFGSLDAKGWLRDVIAAGELEAGLPRNQPPGLPPAIKEIPFEILIALWGEGDPSYWHGWIENGWFDIDGDATDQMLDVINDLLGRMLITYPATE